MKMTFQTRPLFKKIVLPFLAFLLPVLFFAAHSRDGQRQNAALENFLDIPGVTEEEAEAITRFRQRGASFVFGMEPSSECFTRQDGSVGGFSALLCDWMSRLFGIPFAPALYDWDDLINGLASHEIDFTGDLTATPERLKEYLMTDSIAARPVKYMVLEGGKRPRDIAESRTVRYGFFEGTSTLEQARPSLVGEYEIRYASNHAMAYRMLESGEIDAVVEEGPFETFFNDYGRVVTEDLAPLVYGPVSLSTRNTELAPFISVMQKALKSGLSKHLSELYAQGDRDYKRDKFQKGLTPEEAAYIRAHGKDGAPVKIAVEYDNYPAAFYNETEKSWQGCALDVLTEIEDLSGLRFAQIHHDKLLWPDMLNMLERGEIALVSQLIVTDEKKGRFIWPDQPYMTDKYALISRIDTPNIAVNEVFGARVGLSKDTAYTDRFNLWFPKHTETREYSDVLGALAALGEREIDFVMGTQNHLLALTNYMEKSNFKANIVFNQVYGSYFGIDKNETILCSILDKSLRMIDTEVIAGHWKNRVFDYQRALVRARTPWLIGGSALMLFAAAVLLVLFFKTRQTGKILEQLVRKRTAELEIQTKAARAASEAKSSFLARMSHEIRTPMNAVIGMSELAIREYGKPEGLDFIAEIRQAGTNLLAIVNDILDFSKIEAGSMQINQLPYDLASLLNDVLTIIQVRIKEKPVRLISDIDPALPAVLDGDETRVRQILLNLLSNAAKYTREGFVKVSAWGERTGDGKIKLTFRVTDSGIGIKPEDMEKLFGNFVRVDQSRNVSVEGSGLGLVIASNLCRAMGGDISVESEYGKGSVFTAVIVQMIIDDRPLGDIGGKISTTPQYENVRFTAPGVRALLVDDIDTNLKVIEGLLAPYGMSVSTCLNGRKAIELMKKEFMGKKSFDIVFMDHMMPEMNGLEATVAIRGMEGDYFKTVPIIALTANAISGVREMFLENGFNDYLAKPIEIPKLNEIMERWIPKGKRVKRQRRSNRSGRSDRSDSPAPVPETGIEIEIEGIDVSRGLAMTGGTGTGYMKVLETYCRDAGKRIEILGQAPDGMDLPSFTTQVHALKSASASIGADEISRMAAALESAGSKGDMEYIRENLDSFLEKLTAATERIKIALSRKTAISPISPGGECRVPAESLNLLKNALASENVGDVDRILADLDKEQLDEAAKDSLSRISDLVLVGEFEEASAIAKNLE